jgi:hypothetical protein
LCVEGTYRNGKGAEEARHDSDPCLSWK